MSCYVITVQRHSLGTKELGDWIGLGLVPIQGAGRLERVRCSNVF